MFAAPNATRTIVMEKSVLLDALRKNREIHRAEFEEAQAEFLLRLEAELKEALKRVKKSSFEELAKLSVNPRAPVSHLAEFDEVIEMMEFSTSDEITIDSVSFRAYVKNQWAWSDSFKALIGSYKVAGSMLN